MVRRVPLPLSTLVFVFLAVSIGGIAAGCGGDDPSPASAAKIESFQAEPELLEGPGEVTLSWRTSGASTLELSRGTEPLDLGDAPIAEGAVKVFVDETDDFRLVAADSKGRKVQSRISVVVADDGRPVIGSFDAPEFVPVNAEGIGSFAASWQGVRRAETLSLEVQGREPRSLDPNDSGSVELEIDGDVTLTLRATNQVGERTATLEVRLARDPLIDSFTADRSRVGTGEEVDLSWATTNAVAVSLWVNDTKVDDLEPTKTTGKIAVPIFMESTIELRAENELGETASETIHVAVGSPSIEEFELSATSVWLGESLDMSWLTFGGSRLELSEVDSGEAVCEADAVSTIHEGDCSWTPTVPGIYSLALVVSNSSGAASAEREIVVGTGAVIERFTISPAALNEGEEAQLSWSVRPDPAGNVPGLSLRDDLGGSYHASLEAGRLDIVAPAVGTRTFTLEATTDDTRSSPAIATTALEVYALPLILAQASPEHFDDAIAEEVVVSWTAEHVAALTLERRTRAGGPADETIQIPETDLAQGSWGFLPLEETTIRLIATNRIGGTTEVELIVTVADIEVVSFGAEPRSFTQGQPVTLSWQTRMADEIKIEAPGFGSTYLTEEVPERYFDLERQGGTRLNLRSCGGAIATSGCGTITFPQGFRFPYGGAERDRLLVYTQGIMTFDDQVVGTVPSTPDAIPTKEAAAWIHMMPYWDTLAWDADRYPGGNLFWSEIEDEKGKGLAIQWKDAGIWNTSGGPQGYLDVSLNFMVILREDGSFEYRYGNFLKRTSNLPDQRRNLANASVGFQLPDRSDEHQLAYFSVVSLLGPISDRSFSYRPLPELAKSGQLTWYPLARQSSATATLRASRGSATSSKSLNLTIARKPIIELSPVEIPPTMVGEDFVVGWKAFDATSLQIVDAEGAERCRAVEATLEEGVCGISESIPGLHEYTVRAEGAHGFVSEYTFEVRVFGEFGVYTFTADSPSVEKGAGVNLHWTTFNAVGITLFRDGVEIMSRDEGGDGSFFVENIDQETEFTLRAIDEFGISDEASLTIKLWEVLIDLQPDRTNVRPGEPITVTVDVRSLDGGEPRELTGILPLIEVKDPAHRFRSISEEEGILEIPYTTMAADASRELELPFSFPYMGKTYDTVTMYPHGFISFNHVSGIKTNNVPLPSTADSNVELAAFWDQIAHHNVGRFYAGQVGGAFILEWSKVSMTSSSASTNRNNLNIQIVLFPDGRFEYRYGEMRMPGIHVSCLPTQDCRNEVMGSSATIGYQFDGGQRGYLFHFGGTTSGVNNPVFYGGLENRTFAYPRKVGAQTFTFWVSNSQDLSFCALSDGEEVCKTLPIQAEFGLGTVSVSPNTINPGESTTISWESVGGLELKILVDGRMVHEVTNPSEIDSGSWVASPSKDTTYVVELSAGSRFARAIRTVDVQNHKLTASIGESAGPGKPVNLSWELVSGGGSGLSPVVFTPMEESDGGFYDLDISADPDAEQLIGGNANSNNVALTFKNGFTFPYFGTEHRSLRVTADGYLTTLTASSSDNAEIPDVGQAGKLIMPFWDDLHTRLSGRVFAKPLGADRYIIQWSRVSLAQGTANTNEGSLNFMVVLHRDGSFEFRYGAMEPPPMEPTGTSRCYPESCLYESNGSSATIGYMSPDGSFAQVLHFGGLRRGEGQEPMPGGLAFRSWKFTSRSTSGSVTVHPTNTTTYSVCAYETTNHVLTCAPAVEVEIPWGIDFFIAGPETPLPGGKVDLSWKVMALDSLRVMEGETELRSYTGEEIPHLGSLEVTPSGRTTYSLIGSSLNRTVSKTITVSPRLFDLAVSAEDRIYKPGESLAVEWELTSRTSDEIAMITPMTEIDSSPGAPGAYQDISSLEGARLLPIIEATGREQVELPFAFPYLGTEQTAMFVYFYGYLSFSPDSANGNSSNVAFPINTGTAVRVHLAPFWTQLALRGPDKIYSYSPDANTMIIQWTGISHAHGSNSSNVYDLNFQVVLRSDGSFEYRYGRMRPPQQPFFSASCVNGQCKEEANGSNATIGYQNVDASLGSNLHVGAVGGAQAQSLRDAPVPDNYIEFPGGIENRSFAYRPVRTGRSTITAGRSGNYEVCAVHSEFSVCESVFIRTEADPGDLAITEVMIDPAGGKSAQWFEVRNLSKRTLELEGFKISSNTGSHTIEGRFPIGPGEFKTLAASDQVGFIPDYIYGAGLPFEKHLDNLEVRAGTSVLSAVKWTVDWAVPRNDTLAIDPHLHEVGKQSRTDPTEWCRGGPFGSPGQLGPSCLDTSYIPDIISTRPFIDISQTGTRFHEVEGVAKLARLPYSGPAIRLGGQLYSRIWVASNGWLSFADVLPTTSPNQGAPGPFPRRMNASSAVGPLVGGFWAPLRCERALQPDCKFLYERREVDGSSVLLLQWENYRFKNQGSLTFQIQVWENGDVVVAFDRIDNPYKLQSDDWKTYRGGSSWIGIEASAEDVSTGHLKRDIDLDHRSFHFIHR